MKEQARKIAEDLESLLYEFYRENKSGKGSGYGRRLMIQELLAFAKETVEEVFEKYAKETYTPFYARGIIRKFKKWCKDWWEQKKKDKS